MVLFRFSAEVHHQVAYKHTCNSQDWIQTAEYCTKQHELANSEIYENADMPS